MTFEEIPFENRFELNELSNYVSAAIDFRNAYVYNFDIQDLYMDAYVTTKRTELGLTAGGGNVEHLAIKLVDRKKNIREKTELLEMAMEELTPRERDVIQVTYFDRKNDLGLSMDYFNAVLRDAQRKLCSFLGGKRLDSIEEYKKQQNADLKRRIHAS